MKYQYLQIKVIFPKPFVEQISFLMEKGLPDLLNVWIFFPIFNAPSLISQCLPLLIPGSAQYEANISASSLISVEIALWNMADPKHSKHARPQISRDLLNSSCDEGKIAGCLRRPAPFLCSLCVAPSLPLLIGQGAKTILARKSSWNN